MKDRIAKTVGEMKIRFTKTREGGNLMKNRIAKTIPMVLALILMLPLLAGCPVQAPEVDPTPIAETRIVVDQRGIEVEMPKEVERVVVFPPPVLFTLYAIAGSGEHIVGMPPFTMAIIEDGLLAERAPELLRADTGFAMGADVTINIEALLKLNPCVVFAWGHFPEVVEMVERVGLSVIVMNPFVAEGESPQSHFEDWIRIVGEVFNKEEHAAELVRMQWEMIAEITTRVAAEIEQVDRPRTLLFAWPEDGLIRTTGGCPFFNLWVEGSGGINITKDLPEWALVNMEEILKMNPEVIFLLNLNNDVMPQDILENRIEGQDWSQVDAVINGRVYRSPFGIACWSLMGWEQALMFKWAAQKYFPEEFADLDMNQIVREFYRDFYNWELSDAEIRTILHYDVN